MKTTIKPLVTALITVFFYGALLAQNSLPYLGQTPPDLIPKRFGDASMQSNGSWWWHGSPKFSPDGKEMFFAKYHQNLLSNNMKIYIMKDVNGDWTVPVLAAFADEGNNTEPVYSNDGNTLFFVSDRDGASKIYFVTRDGNEWTDPEIFNLPYDLLPGGLCWDFSFANDGTIYYTVWENSNSEIYMSIPVNGQYVGFEKLPIEINTTFHDFAPCISPDGKYLIFASQKSGGFGASDVYISFKNWSNAWTAPINAGNLINGTSEDAMPAISPDGKYLFFNSAKTGDYGYNAYWVDIDMITNLNPFTGIENGQNQKSIKVFPNPVNEILNIDIENNTGSKIEVFNICGQSVFSKENIYLTEQIDVSNFNSGIYIIEISNANLKYQQKLIVE